MSSSKKNVVPLIMDFIKGGNSQPASKPGFGHAVKLSYNVIAKERLSWNETKKSLTYRYKFVNNTPASTGLLVALMDELTTDACFGYGQPSAPGLSLQMQMQLVSGGPLLSTYSELDIVSTVTKLGRTISFVKCDFYDTTTTAGKLVAFGSHVKYMPTGSFFTDLVFTKSWAWNLYTSVLLGKSSPKYYEEKDLIKEVIGAHLDYQGLGSATFNITEEHMNPFGGMHVSGCCVCLSLLTMLLLHLRSVYVRRKTNFLYDCSPHKTNRAVVMPS